MLNVAMLGASGRMGRTIVPLVHEADDLRLSGALAADDGEQKRGRHRDPVSGDWIRGYDRRAGILIVYKSYDKVSHALVMDAHHPLRVDDVVGRP